MKFLYCFLSALLLATLATAQGPDQAAGLSRVTMGPIDVNTPTNWGVSGGTGNQGCLGVQFLRGEYFVTARGSASPATGNHVITPPHTVYVFDSAGALLRRFPQLPTSSSSAWGYRDGLTDGQRTLAFGYDTGIDFIDPFGAPAPVFMTNAGPVPVVGTWTSAGYSGTYRALAYDPNQIDPPTGRRTGSFFVASFSSTIYELAFPSGAVLNTWPNLPSPNDWSAYGFALDPIKTTPREAYLWVNSAPNAGNLGLYRLPRAGIGSTAVKEACREIVRQSQPTSAQGGLTGVPGGTNGIPGEPGSFWDLVGLNQGAPDEITGYRVHLYPGLDGTQETRLVGGVAPGMTPPPLDEVTGKSFAPRDVLWWDFDNSCNGRRAPAAVWMNFSVAPFINEAGPDGLSTFLDPNFELRVLWPGSAPPGLFPYFLPPNSTAGGAPVPLGPVPPGVFSTGDMLRIQGMYIDVTGIAPFPVLATNQIRFVAL